jgi:glycosyltransferase involved in cell wall biosynthesis
MAASEARIALVQDALPFMGGAERSLAAVLELYPRLPIYTVVYNQEAFSGNLISSSPVHTSFIDRLPGKRTHYKVYAPFFPLAVEQFDLRSYDLVISFHYAFAHGVLTQPGQLHISYTYTPLRYAWHAQQESFSSGKSRLGELVLRIFSHYFRTWDFAAAARVDHFVAVSSSIAQRVWRSYRRSSEVIYPPVDVNRFTLNLERDSYYISLGRLVPSKRVDLVVSSFSRLGLPLLVVGDGPERRRLAHLAGSNVRLVGRIPDEEVALLLSRAKALVHAAEEDFGIVPVEAQAAGCPVIAFGSGGVLETVVDGETGFFFSEQSADSLVDAVLEFENRKREFDPGRIRQNSLRFSKERFQFEFRAMVEREKLGFCRKDGLSLLVDQGVGVLDSQA